jgi:hypothetical protein
MAINTTRSDYNYYLPIWEKCRHCVEGQERIHLQGQLYLPRLSGQTDEEYWAYVTRALFYNATQRTVDAMTGLIFRKDPIVKVPTAIIPWLDDIDLNGNSLTTFVENIAEEIEITGGFGLLVEHPEVVVEDGIEITQAQAQAQNIRPFFAKYTVENILNWRVKTINNQKYLHLVVLKETHEDVNEELNVSEVTYYRVLDLDPETGHYRQRVYSLEDDQKTFKQEKEVYPLMNGQRMNFIPFFRLGPKGITYEIEKPPIIDLVNVNLSHYRTTADLEHGAHFTGLPTAVVTGHSIPEGGEPLKIGSANAWVFSEENAKAHYLEFTGTGLGALEKRLEKKEQQMVTLGARMLAPDTNTIEAADTHSIKRQGENSVLASIAYAIESSIEKALQILIAWANVQGEVGYLINKDFVPSKMSSQDLLASFQVYQAGGMAFSDFIQILQKGEVIDSQRTPEMIKSEIDVSGPMGGNFNSVQQPQ